MNRFFGTDDNADGDRGAAESALPTVAARRIGAPDAKSTAPRSGRIAMVVGNAAYAGGQLKNPLNDANLVATVLDGLGFDVEQVTDAGKSALEFAIVAFGSRLRQAGEGVVGFFYYAGHGIQHQGQNYLIPVDARIPEARFLRSGAIKVDFLLGEVGDTSASANIIVLDACRNNPIPVASVGAETLRGLAAIDNMPDATAIVFSTAAGSVAADGDGDNSPYAEALARALARSGATLGEVVFEAARLVGAATSGRQRPALFVQGALPDVAVGAPHRPELPKARTDGPWGKHVEAEERPIPGSMPAIEDIPDPRVTLAKPIPFGMLIYGLSGLDWEQGFPGDLVNEVIDTGRWSQVEAGFARAEPYAATLVAIRNMIAHRGDWGAPDNQLAGRAALLGARAGIGQAFVVLGWLYSVGAGGLPRDFSVQRRVLAGLAERGYVFGQLQYGVLLANGVDMTPAPAQGIGWLEKAASAGNLNALVEIGLLYTDLVRVPFKVDFEKARHYLARAASEGSPRAAATLAGLHLDGKLKVNDQDELTGLLDAAAHAGDVQSIFRRGLRREHGDGIARDMSGALSDYRAAAKAGSTDAMLALFHHSAFGSELVAPDPTAAVQWAKAATARGNAGGHMALGALYESGVGVEASGAAAANEYTSAAAAGIAAGHIGLARVAWKAGRDAAVIARHADAARAGADTWSREQAYQILSWLETAARLTEIAGLVGLDDVAVGQPGARVGLVVFHALTDPASAQFHTSTVRRIRERFVESGHVRLIFQEAGDKIGAGPAALVRAASKTTRMAILDALLGSQTRWAVSPDLAKALAAELAPFDYDAARVAQAITFSRVQSQVLHVSGEIASRFAIRKLPTVFVNGRRLVQPTERELERAILFALPPETAVRLNNGPLGLSSDNPD